MAALVAGTLGAGTGPAGAADAAAAADNSPPAAGHWSTSFEPGTPRPAGFPAVGAARNLRGETTRVTTTVSDIRSDHPNDTSTSEGVPSLADQDPGTKWYAKDSGRPTADAPVHATYTLRNSAAVTGYSLTAADDAAPRDPAAWTVLGSNSDSAAKNPDDASWKVLDRRKEQRFDRRGQTGFYSIGAPRAYRHYQLRITDNCADRCEGSADDSEKLQLADWTLRSSAGSGASALGVSVENADAAGAADGSAALRYSGRVLGSGAASSTVVLRSGLDVPIGEKAELRYRIRPQDAASEPVALDVVHTDKDGQHPRTRKGEPGDGAPEPGEWTTVSAGLGDLAGRRVSEIRLRYADGHAKSGATPTGWIDDIVLGKAALDGSAAWSYLDAPDVDPARGDEDRTAWTRPGFDDGDVPWKEATGPFGAKNDGTDLGDGFPVETELKLRKESGDNLEAYFFRTSFSLDRATLDSMTGLLGTVVHDDSVTVYANGHRIAGRGDGQIEKNLQYQKPDGGDGEGDPATTRFGVPAAALKEGSNTLAVEVHQSNSTSSDAYFGLGELAQTTGTLPFTGDELDTSYDSDKRPDAPDGGDYVTWMLRSFDAARNTPSLMGANEVLPEGTSYEDLTAVNDRTVVDINNAPSGPADPKVHKALIDGASSPYRSMSDGLGSTLGRLYDQALKNGELPKTQALLDGRIEKTPDSDADWYQEAKNNYQYKRPFVRMGFSGEKGLIEPWDSRGGYDGLAGDGSFPSGHTSHGYAQGITLATLLPELAPQILARASEYGDNRVVLAFHYPTDIMGGRIVGAKTAQLRWSDPEFRELLSRARDELTTVLGQKCREIGAGSTPAECADHGKPYLPTDQALKVYRERMSYGYPHIGEEGRAPSVPAGAEDLLRTAHPKLTGAERRAVLAATQTDSGAPLDEQGEGGSWQRTDLAAAMTAKVTAHEDGTLTVDGVRVDAEGVRVAEK
ncbi:acid phosphatase [Streptomyces triticagri]|uniref:acid phosphatase n=1 Tax=Streptomyces triticagri TaxID=2293568 RepID=UPI001F362619|nr:phosphatase PAP2 family protein [Streptomyces triticagri]